jgi:CheY-like chemotaxis protein
MGRTSKKASIVVVEDNPADVLLIRKGLEGQGVDCDLTCFDDGDIAVRGLSQEGRLLPDLILLDLKLCKLDGFDVLQSIRSMPNFVDVPVIILTSSESPSDKQRTARMGAARYIRKPSQLDEFFREVGQGVEEILRHKND